MALQFLAGATARIKSKTLPTVEAFQILLRLFLRQSLRIDME